MSLKLFLQPLVEQASIAVLGSSVSDNQIERAVQQLVRFRQSMASHHIHLLIEQYLGAHGDHQNVVSGKLCAELVRIFNTPFVIQVASFLAPASIAVNSKSKNMQTFSLAKVVTARRLQSGGPVLDMSIGGDVLMVPSNIDSSYNAFLGATGTTVMVPVGSKPLNITNSFP